MMTKCARCGRTREVLRLTVCGIVSEFPRPCVFCAPAITREHDENERRSRVQMALNDCGTTRPRDVPPELSVVLDEVVERTKDPGSLVVVVGGIETGKTTIARGWVVAMAERGLSALYLPAVQAMAPHADALVADWAKFDAVAVDGLAQDGARLNEWQSTRLAHLCSSMKEHRLLLTTPWARRLIVHGEEVDGWPIGLGAAAAVRLGMRAKQRSLPVRQA